MKTIVITPANKNDFNLLNTLVKKLGIPYKVIDEENKEDFALLQLMLAAKEDENIDEKEIMEILDEK